MKKTLIAAVMMALMLMTGSVTPASKATVMDNPSPVDYERYTSYFEGNNTGLTGTSFLMFNTQDEFDKIFHPAAAMGKNSFLPGNVWDNRFVFAVVKRGNFITNYGLTSVMRDFDKLRINYEATDKPTPYSTNRSPVILAIDKTDFDFSEIIVTENSRVVFRQKVTD